MCLFTDNTSCSIIQTQNQKALVHLVQSTRAHTDHWHQRERKALFVHLPAWCSSLWWEDPRCQDMCWCSVGEHAIHMQVTRLNDITLCPPLAAWIYSLWFTNSVARYLGSHMSALLKWNQLACIGMLWYATYPDNSQVIVSKLWYMSNDIFGGFIILVRVCSLWTCRHVVYRGRTTK